MKTYQVSRTFLSYYLLLVCFSHQFYVITFHWSLRDSKSAQVSRTLSSILAALNNLLVRMFSLHPLISKYSSSSNKPLVNVPKALTTVGIIVTFMVHSFFNSLARSRILIFLFTFFQFYSVISRDIKVNDFPSFLFFFFCDYFNVWSSGRD